MCADTAAAIPGGKEAVGHKALQIEQLEEQVREQAVAYEARRRDVIHQATLKARTLQDIIQQVQTELKKSQERFPQELRAREETIVHLNQELAQQQARHQQILARYDRAQATLARRGHQKETSLHAQLEALKEEWAKKIAARDTEIAALQSNLLAKETERQGELDRLAKQFSEERFQLEKSKEEVEWKLKDHKEVSERQLGGRQKEIHFIENEITRAKLQRDQQLSQKTAVFEAGKNKWQANPPNPSRQAEETGHAAEEVVGGKEARPQS